MLDEVKTEKKIIEKTIIKEIHDTPIVVDFATTNALIQANAEKITDLGVLIEELGAKVELMNNDDVLNSISELSSLVVAIATEVGNPEEEAPDDNSRFRAILDKLNVASTVLSELLLNQKVVTSLVALENGVEELKQQNNDVMEGIEEIGAIL